MGDPVLGIKLFCVCVCVFIVLHIMHKFMAASRAIDHKFNISNLEGIVMILKFLCIVLMPLMLLWSAIAWIIN